MGYRLVSNAYLCVDFFFVLSGFVVCHAYRDRLSDAGSWLSFVVRRFGRLWPLHATMLAAFVAFIGLVNLLPHPDRFALTWGPSEYSVVAIPLHALLLNAVNLHGMAWNAPSWSIGAEFYTYLLFGAACILAGRGLTLAAAALALACVALLGVVSPTYMNSTADFGLVRCLAGFFTGVVAYRLYQEGRGRSAAISRLAGTAIEMAAVVLVATFVIFAGRGPDAVAVVSLAAPLVFAVAVLVFARESGHLSRLLRVRPLKALGRWSYSIYLGHQLVLMAAAYGVWAFARWQGLDLETQVVVEGHVKTLYAVGGGLGSLALLAAILTVVIALAALTYARVEEPARQTFNGLAKRMDAGAWRSRFQPAARRASSAS